MKIHYFIRVMKLTIILILVGLVSANASIYSQTITLNMKNLSIKEVASEVKKQTGYVISGSSTIISGMRRISVDVEGMPIHNFLDHILNGQNITYKKEGKNIVLIKGTKPIIDNKADFITVQQQRIDVTGTVRDSLGRPISGVSVHVMGSKMGTSSSDRGYFSLPNVAQGAFIQFKALGYKDITLKASEKMDVLLVAQLGDIDEVVVNTGYQKIARERATGAVTTVTSDQLESRFTPNIMDNLEGRVAGLVKYGDRIMIRGTGTLFAESRPLLVVDGLPVEMAYEDLNPYDVESITILKDAAASAIYGARASNGVIIVTTKRAKDLNKIDVEISSNTTVWENRNIDYADNWYMTPAQQVDKENEYFKWLYNEAPDAAAQLTAMDNSLKGTGSFNLNPTPIQYAHYQLKKGLIQQDELDRRLAQYKTQNFAKDYADNLLRTRVLQMHNLSVRNRTNNFQSNLVVNYKGDNTGKISDKDHQLNAFYKGTYDMTKWLTINFSVNNIFQRSTQRRSNYVENTMDPFSLPAYYSLFNPDGTQANISPGWTHYYNPYASWVEDNKALRPMHYYLLDEVNLNKHKIERQNTRYHGEFLFKILEGLTFNTQ